MDDKWKDPEVFDLVIAARRIVLQFNNAVIQEHMCSSELAAYHNIYEVVGKYVPMVKD